MSALGQKRTLAPLYRVPETVIILARTSQREGAEVPLSERTDAIGGHSINFRVTLFDTAGTTETLVRPQSCLRTRDEGAVAFPRRAAKLGGYSCWDTLVGSFLKHSLQPSAL